MLTIVIIIFVLKTFFVNVLPDVPEDMPEYDFGFDNDDDLGDAESIQALSNAEKSLDTKPEIKVLQQW